MNIKTVLSRQHESDLASVLPGASRTAASGSRRESHDVQTLVTDINEWWRVRYEAKCTQKKSYSFKLSEWKDLVETVYSRDAHERPAWAIRFYGEGEDPQILEDLVVVDLDDWVELLEELEQLRGKAKQVSKTN